jgi:type IV pilus assembly protein PilC
MAFLVLSGLMLTIVPMFANIFKTTVASTYTPGSGPPPSTALPAMTQFMLNLSHLLYPDSPKNLEWLGQVVLRFIILGVLIFALKRLVRYVLFQPGPRRRWDAFKLRAPMKVGPLVQKIVVARFARTFSSLLASGIQAVDALPIAAETAGNAIVSDALMKAQSQMLAGGTIYEPLERSGAFPIIVTRMIKIGEESGQLELMLQKVAEFFEEEVELKIKGLTSLLEPLMIIFLGSLIGVVIISCYLPMFDIYNKIG